MLRTFQILIIIVDDNMLHYDNAMGNGLSVAVFDPCSSKIMCIFIMLTCP